MATQMMGVRDRLWLIAHDDERDMRPGDLVTLRWMGVDGAVQPHKVAPGKA